MKVLIFGPSGSGKTYLAHALQKSGVAAYDDEDIKGLSSWYDKHGNKILPPETADEALNNQYSFLWSKRFLTEFLKKYQEIYLFGGSGNLFNMLDLFDKTSFLKIDSQLQKERISSSSRATALMDFNDKGMVVWGDWLEQEAKNRNIPFVDAALSPQEIFEIISKW